MQDDDDGAGDAVQKVAGVGADDSGTDADGKGGDEHFAEAAAEEEGGSAGGDEQGDDEDGADGLQGGDDGGADQQEKRPAQAGDGKAGGDRLDVVEEVEHQVAPFGGEDDERNGADGEHLPEVVVVDAEDVAVDDRLQVDGGRVEGDDEKSGGEKSSEDEADDGVLAQHRQAFQDEHGRGGEDAGGKGAEGVGQFPQVGEGDAGDDRMRERVADQRPTLEHEVNREQGANAADSGRADERLDHEVVLQRGEQRTHGQLLRSSTKTAGCSSSLTMRTCGATSPRPMFFRTLPKARSRLSTV